MSLLSIRGLARETGLARSTIQRYIHDHPVKLHRYRRAHRWSYEIIPVLHEIKNHNLRRKHGPGNIR